MPALLVSNANTADVKVDTQVVSDSVESNVPVVNDQAEVDAYVREDAAPTASPHTSEPAPEPISCDDSEDEDENEIDLFSDQQETFDLSCCSCFSRMFDCCYCDAGNRIVKGVPVEPIVWTKRMSMMRFPELEENQFFARTTDVGLTFSGGGNRSSAQSLGLLQALHKLGLLHKVRYISSVSGGSWCSAPFCYLPDHISLDTFLAPGASGPHHIKDDTLGKGPKGSYLAALINANPLKPYIDNAVFDDFTCDCFHGDQLHSWNHAIGQAYLEPFNLFRENSVMSVEKGTKGYSRAKHETSNAKTRVEVIPMRKGGPMPIINASAIVSDLLKLPLEFTPMYSGLPVRYYDDKCVYGGGVVESFGIGSLAPKLPDGSTTVRNGQQVTVTPSSFISLPFAMGTSSSAVVSTVDQGLHTDSYAIDQFFGGASIPLWSPADVDNGYSAVTVAVDGNATDNSGVCALLRRKVKRVIANMSGGVDILSPDFLTKISWFPDLFLNAAGPKVFDELRWPELFMHLQEKAMKGEPCVHEQHLEVFDNKRFGVVGGWKVHIIWIYPNMSKEFEQALPKDIQALFQQDPVQLFTQPENVNKDFPYVRTDLGNFEPKLLHLLAENSAWQLVKGIGEKKLNDFIEG